MYETELETWSLAKFFGRIYSILAMGVAVSAIVSFLTITMFPKSMLVINHFSLIFIWVVEIALVVILQKSAMKNTGFALPGFILFSAVNGFSLSYTIAAYMHFYSPTLVLQAFLTTCLMFGVLAVIGAKTSKNLSGVGQACYGMLWGLIIAGILSLFFPNGMVGFALSVISVLVFSGLIAWDNQKIRVVYEQNNGQVSEGWAVAMGLSLYLDFINLFINILRIFAGISSKD